jgi:hypothetical protein
MYQARPVDLPKAYFRRVAPSMKRGLRLSPECLVQLGTLSRQMLFARGLLAWARRSVSHPRRRGFRSRSVGWDCPRWRSIPCRRPGLFRPDVVRRYPTRDGARRNTTRLLCGWYPSGDTAWRYAFLGRHLEDTQQLLGPLGQVPVRVLCLSKERGQLLVSCRFSVQNIRHHRIGPFQSVVEHGDEVVVLVAGTGGTLPRIHLLSSFRFFCSSSSMYPRR